MNIKRISYLVMVLVAMFMAVQVPAMKEMQAADPPFEDDVIDNFNDGSHTAWTKVNINSPGESGGEFYGTCANNDPYMYRTVNFSADDNKFICIRLKLQSGSGTNPVIFWKRSGDAGYSASRQALVPYAVADGQYRTYTVDLSNHAYWNGTITGFRFDAPTGSTGKVFYLDYISAGNMVFIDNGTVRVGVRMDWGAAITEFGYNTTNLINNTDTGRLMQVALRSGDDSYYPDDPMDDRNGWNPNQGGDKYNTGSPVVDYSIGNGTIYTKTRSYEWNPDNKGGGDGSPVLSDVYVEQWVSFETNLMVKVDYKVTYLGTVPRSLHNQEFPCIFASGTFTDFWSYVGTSPWTGAALTQQTAMPVTWFTSEYWATAANAGGFGVTLYTPQEYRSPRFYCNNLPDARIAPCNYFVSNPIFAIMPDGIYETTVYMICGNVATARGQITNYLRPYETVTTEWHFSTDDYAEGWYAAHDMDLDEFSVSGGYMSCETSNTDPYFAYSWAADCLASSYSEIEIRMKVTSGTVGQIYFTTIADQTWDASKRKTFTVTPGASYYTYTIDMSTVGGWSGRIKEFRIDPTTSSGATVSIDYIKLKP